MNIITKLTLRYLKENRQRTLTTIVGVIISVAMITAIPTLLASVIDMGRRQSMRDAGKWHAAFYSIPAGDVSRISQDKNTASVAIIKPLGYAEFKESRSYNKSFLYFAALDDTAIDNFRVELVDGRLPLHENEIALSDSVGKEGGVIYKIGDKLDVVIGQRVVPADSNRPEQILTQREYPPYAPGGSEPLEVFIPEQSRTYTITGFVTAGLLENYPAVGFLALSALDEASLASDEIVDVAFTWKHVNKQANTETNRLAGSLGLNAEQVGYNSELLRYYGILSDNNLQVLYGVGTTMMVLILIGSIALIYNAFAISVVERSRQFGVMASVGATRTQKRTAILTEAMLIGMVAIPIGLIAGTWGIGLTLGLLEPFFAVVFGTRSETLQLVVSPAAILISAGVAVVTLLISAWLPSKHAASVTPIDSIRMSKDIRLKSKDVNTSDLTRHLFGFEAELGLKNLKRNGRRYAVIIFSLVISIVLFLGITAFTKYGFSAASTRVVELKYPVQVRIISDIDPVEKQGYLRQISRLDGVTDAALIETVPMAGQLATKYLNPKLVQYLSTSNSALLDPTLISYSLDLLDAEDFNNYLAENQITHFPSEAGEAFPVVLVNAKMTPFGSNLQPTETFAIPRGEILKFGFLRDDAELVYETSFLIAAIASKDIIDLGIPNYEPRMLLIGNRDAFYEWKPNPDWDQNWNDLRLALNAQDTDKLTDAIIDFRNTHPTGSMWIDDHNANQRADRNIRVIVQVFSYGFLALITMVGIANIYNTVMTSIAQRKQEFAMLRAVGITSDGLKKMIRYESFFYGSRALVIGVIVGTGVNYLLFRQVSTGFEIKFAPPWLSIMIVTLAVLAVVGLTMLAATRHALNDNIVETLKNENY